MIYSSIFSMTDFANLFINDGIYVHIWKTFHGYIWRKT